MSCICWPDQRCHQLVQSSMPVKENNLLESVLPNWGPEYKVEVDIKFSDWTSKWGSVFRFSGVDGDCCKIGQRIPAMWTRQGSNDQLYIATNIDEDGDRVFHDQLGRFEKGRWHHFIISQRKDEVKLKFYHTFVVQTYAYNSEQQLLL